MNELTSTVAQGFSAAFQDFLKRVHTLAEPLTEEQFWRKPYPYGNSFGHLVLHLTGNLSHYIGAEIARTGYVRDREREFTDPQPPTKAQALQGLDAAVALVLQTVAAPSAEDWSAEYKAVGADNLNDRFSIMLRCAAHLFHHVGQMIYLAKEHARQ
jgi:hypothetical protein